MKTCTYFKNNPAKAFAFVSVLLSSIATANASIIALESVRGVGNQEYNGSLGMHFDVLSPINVIQLGAFDSEQNGFSSTIQVGIFNRNTQQLVTEIAIFNGSSDLLIGQSRFIDTTDVELGIGNYSIVAQGFDNLNPNGNTRGISFDFPIINNGGGLISFVGASYHNDGSSVFEYPLEIDTGPENRYDAGTFQFEAVSNVPAPAAVWLLGSGLIGLIGMRKKSMKLSGKYA